MELDSSRFPLIVVHWHGPVSDDVLEQFIVDINALADRASSEQRHYAIVSIGDADFGPRQRKRIADWSNAMPDYRARYDLGNFVVLHGAMARGALTAIKWLSPRLSKMHVFADEQGAMRAAEQSLIDATAQRAI